MKALPIRLATLTLLAAASDPGNAQVVVKQEPMDMRSGSTVLVDDGTCPKGMIKLLTGTHGTAMTGAPVHDAKCIPRKGVAVAPTCGR